MYILECADQTFYVGSTNDLIKREKQIQGWSRQKKIALINKNIKELKLLAQCQNNSHHKNFNSNTSEQSNSSNDVNN